MRRETVHITASAFDERTILIHKNGKVCGELKVKDNGGHVPMTEIVRRINFDPAKVAAKRQEEDAKVLTATKTITPLEAHGHGSTPGTKLGLPIRADAALAKVVQSINTPLYTGTADSDVNHMNEVNPAGESN